MTESDSPLLVVQIRRGARGWIMHVDNGKGRDIQLIELTARDAATMLAELSNSHKLKLIAPNGAPASPKTTTADDSQVSSDAMIRRALRQKLFYDDAGREVTIWEELTSFGSSTRLDLATITDQELVTYEIKSGRDTLERLPQQMMQAEKVADRAYLVCDPKHLSSARAILPDWWGLWSVAVNNDKVEFQEIRSALPNPTPGRGRSLLDYLQRQDALTEVRALTPDSAEFRSRWRDAGVSALREYLLNTCSDEELRAMGRRALMKRNQNQRLGRKNRLLRQQLQIAQQTSWRKFLNALAQ